MNKKKTYLEWDEYFKIKAKEIFIGTIWLIMIVLLIFCIMYTLTGLFGDI